MIAHETLDAPIPIDRNFEAKGCQVTLLRLLGLVGTLVDPTLQGACTLGTHINRDPCRPCHLCRTAPPSTPCWTKKLWI